jgi:2-hydroxymuconate-semialdehyde hydrolase
VITRSDARKRILAGTPVSERVLDIDGIPTSLLEAGRGPVVILLHGGIECGGAYWSPVIPRLAERFRIVAPDVPGLGESVPFEKFGTERFADWFEELIRATNADQPVVVAHSLLGSFAAQFAVDHSDLLGRLVIYGAPGVGPYRAPLRLMYVAMRLSFRPTPKNDERFARFALLDFDATRARDIDWFDAFSTYSLERAVVPHVKRTMKSLISLGMKRIPDDELRRISTPVDLLWGEGDRMVPRSVGQAASHRMGWPMTTIANSGHAPHIEQPEQFVSALITLAERNPSVSARTNRTDAIRDVNSSDVTLIGAGS